MSTDSGDRLYSLLPEIYRIRDAQQDQSLRALFAILEQEFLALESDIEGLYNNWFIETCDEWVVPYIGDLLKVPALHSGGIGGFTLRSYVANVLAYRRRKGTSSVLEQMAHDVSGWPVRVVEFHKSLATTQHLNHVRASIPATMDLRDTKKLALLGGPFQQAAYRAEVRNIVGGRGKYNIPNVGLFLWRLQSYTLIRAQAADQGDNCFTFNPLGFDQALFNPPQTETEISHLAEEKNVPGPLRRRPLFDELQARRSVLSQGKTPATIYFGSQPVWMIYLDGAEQPLLPETMMICDLSDWDSELSPISADIKVQIDPQLGRMAFAASTLPARVEVTHAYGFSADLGGGPYNRSESLEGLFADEEQIWWAGVSQQSEVGKGSYPSLTEAIQAWNALDEAASPDVGVIAILDSLSYEEKLTGNAGHVVIREGKKLLIVAANWLSGQIPNKTAWSRELGLNHFLNATRLRPHIKGDISVKGKGSDGTGELFLNGLLLEGKLTVLVGELGRLDLCHCTLTPSDGGLLVSSSGSDSGGHNAQLAITLRHSICGPICASAMVKSLSIADSIIDGAAAFTQNSEVEAIGGDKDSVQPFAPPTTLERSTLFGTVHCKELVQASEVIFTQAVKVERMQAGCVRFSYVPSDSQVPRRFRCQPDLALLEKSRELGVELNKNERQRVALWMRPVFSSVWYGDPHYAQLKTDCTECPRGIRIGAEDGSEMGVFSHLKQAQREANIRTNLKEYLRFGMDAELFYIN